MCDVRLLNRLRLDVALLEQTDLAVIRIVILSYHNTARHIVLSEWIHTRERTGMLTTSSLRFSVDLP